MRHVGEMGAVGGEIKYLTRGLFARSIPTLNPARPHALESVWLTTRFGADSIADTQEASSVE